MAAGFNTGILFLLVVPFLVGVVAAQIVRAGRIRETTLSLVKPSSAP